MTTKTHWGALGAIFTLGAILVATSCTEKFEQVENNQQGIEDIFRPSDPQPKTITVTGYTDNGADSKSVLDGMNVRWTAGDCFSMMGTGSKTETVIKTTRNLTLLSLDDFAAMKTGDSRTVMITSLAYDCYKLGVDSNGNWTSIGHDSKTYTNYGKNLKSQASQANQQSLFNDMMGIANGTNAANFLFTIKKTSGGYSIKSNACGKYISAAEKNKPLNSSEYSLSIKHQDYEGSTQLVILNGDRCAIQFIDPSNSSNFLRAQKNNSPKFESNQNGAGWSFFYLYEVETIEEGEEVTTEKDFHTKFTMEDQTTGSFTGEILEGSKLTVAVFPYSSQNSLKDGKVTIQTTGTQHYAEASFGPDASPAAGILENEEKVSFVNLCGVLKLRLTGSATITSIDLSDNNSSFNLWGKATITTDAIADRTAAASYSGGSNSIKLDCSNGVTLDPSTPKEFHFVVPAGAFASGMGIQLNTTDGTFVTSTNASNTIKRSVIKSMPVIDQSWFEEIVEELPEYNIMNYMIEDYFNNVNYTLADVDNGTSLFESMGFSSKVVNAGRSHTLDQPKKVDVTWTASGTGTATASLYSDKACTQLVDSGTASVSTGKYSFTDLVPYRTYYYKVTNGSTVLTSGGFKTTGQIRMIKIDSSWNIRDLGGWTGLGGKKLKYEMIYRGGDLDRATSAESARLRQLGMMAETDFRVLSDKSEHHTNEGYDEAYVRGETRIQNNDGEVMYYHKCADYATDKGTKTNGTGTILYQREDPDPRMNDVGTLVMHMAFTIHAVNTGHPVYFHCKSGADRTGVFAMLLEGLLGVSPMEIIKEYELTNFSYESEGFNRRHYSSDTAIGKAYRLIRDNDGLGAPASYDTYQKRCYYYFNQYFNSPNCPKRINASDLDAFIMNMLDMGPTEYEQYRPENVYDGGSANSLPSVYYWDCGHDHGWI